MDPMSDWAANRRRCLRVISENNRPQNRRLRLNGKSPEEVNMYLLLGPRFYHAIISSH